MVNLNTYKQKKKELGLTFDQLSKMSGVPLQTLHNIFRGHTQNPRIDTMQAIEEALGLSTPPLQWTEEDKALGVGNHPTYLSEKEWRILNAFNDLERTRGEAFADKMIKMIEDISELPEKK